MVKVNIYQLLTVGDLQFSINDETLHLLLSFIHGIGISGPNIDIKFLHCDDENCQL